jgi:hypothetical protein
MKPIFCVLAGSILVVACNSNDTATEATSNDSIKHEQQISAVNDTANFTSIEWIDSVHQNLGNVTEGGVVEVSWHFKNTGNKPLIISNASASCGCTVAEKPEEPVSPGAEGLIKAKFDSKGREGTQRKDVYVVANTTGQTNHQLSFSVEVKKK